MDFILVMVCIYAACKVGISLVDAYFLPLVLDVPTLTVWRRLTGADIPSTEALREHLKTLVKDDLPEIHLTRSQAHAIREILLTKSTDH